ncbi:MAG: OsmC family protein [Helicobacteraceae bacterium]|jgi:putative redox protein|nr:OsmC family protein [Helicobacteraceae bacterium]
MIVSVTQTEGLKLEATTNRGVKFEIDKEIISPQEYFTIGAIACSATDIILLPEKQGKSVKNLSVSGDFERAKTAPFRFIAVHIIYSFDSDGSDLEASRWVLSSIESYCTTLNTLRGVAKIYYSITHNGKSIADRNSVVSGETSALGSEAENLSIDACPN